MKLLKYSLVLFKFSVICFFAFPLTCIYAENVSISTYYPSPFGSYKHLSIEDGASVDPANVYGSLEIARTGDATGNGSHIAFIRGGTASRMGLGYGRNSDTFGFGPATTGAFSATNLAIDSTGRVGIGTASPGGRLDVVTGAVNSNDYFRVNSGGNTGIELRSGTTGGTPYIDFSNDATTDFHVRLIMVPQGVLQVQGNGFVPPSLNTSQRNSIAAANRVEGMLIYNNETKKMEYWNGSAWVEVGGGPSPTGWISGFYTPVSPNTDPPYDMGPNGRIPTPWIFPNIPVGKKILSVAVTPLHEEDRDAHQEQWDGLGVEIAGDGRSFRVVLRPGAENFARNPFHPTQGESVSSLAWQVNY